MQSKTLLYLTVDEFPFEYLIENIMDMSPFADTLSYNSFRARFVWLKSSTG